MAARLIRGAVAALAVALAALAPAAVSADGVTLEVRTVGDSRILVVDGGLTAGDEDRFAGMLARGPFAEVWFDSPGGSVVAGQGIGRHMRKAGLIGRVPAGSICASACVDAFLGAPVRFVDRPHSVGVHMFSVFASEKIRADLTEKVEQGQVARAIFDMEDYAAGAAARWITYMMEMGVAPSLISWTVRVPHLCVYWLTQQEMLHYNVVNTAGPPRPGFAPGKGRVEHATAAKGCKYAR